MILDSETGSLNCKTHSLLSVGALVYDFDTDKILETFESYIKLPTLADYKVTDRALEVNKINIADCLSKGLPPEEVRDKLLDMWTNHGCSLIGGHNVHFDIRWLAHHLFDGMEPHELLQSVFSFRVLDSMSVIGLMQGVEGVGKGSSLKKAVKTLKIDTKSYKGKLHEALYDATMTALVLAKFRHLLARGFECEVSPRQSKPRGL